MNAVMCSADSVKLRASEGPGLSDNSKSRPGHKGPELGEMLHLPILSDIGVADFGGGGTRWASELTRPTCFCWRDCFPGWAHQIRSSEIH